MNLLLLLSGFRVWSGSPAEVLTRVLGAVSLFALEMQLATWTEIATLTTLVPVNAVAAACLFVWTRRTAAAGADRRHTPAEWRLDAVLAGVALVVLVLAARLPLEAADPYHLERMARIEEIGTLAYDPGAHPKVNVLGWLYELSLADLGAIPVAGPWLVRGHGVIGLIVYGVTIHAVFQILGAAVPPAAWLLALVPVVFHQFVMVKNDLFGAIPAVLALAWGAARAPGVRPLVSAWAGWLTGLAVGMKLTSFPLAIVFGGTVLLRRPHSASGLAASAAGVVTGLIAAGLLFVLVENAAVYGDALAPLGALGNRTTGIAEAGMSTTRFAMSLVDMGVVTRSLWPGRGGWGATYGLPFIWSLCVLVAARRDPLARRTLIGCTAYWLAFSAVYPDADVAHRLALAPGLLAVAVAAALADREGPVPVWLRRLALPIGIVSAIQIARSAVLYLGRA